MTRPIGFSTGALALSDFRRALAILRPRGLQAVELSALRDRELGPLLEALGTLDLSGYSYISFHAPSAFQTLPERDVSRMLRSLLARRWPIIIHPDILEDCSAWDGFGEWLCVENMDKRKPVGRTVAELEPIFARFPQASFCFDVGHARQVDPSMTQAALLLRKYAGRLKQVHVSEVNSRSGHEAISFTAFHSFRKVAHLVPPEVPLILETIIAEDQIEAQMRLAEAVFAPGQGADGDNGVPADGASLAGASARASSSPRS
jgi:hypothetical protein